MLKDLYSYKPNADRIFARLNEADRDAVAGKRGHVFFRALPPCDTAIYTNMKLTRYDFAFETDTDRYVRDLCGEYASSFEARAGLQDIALPNLSPVLGIGDYSAFVGGDILFAEDTSWSKPILNNIDDYKRLAPVGTAPWYGKFLSICEKIMIESAGSGIPFTRGFFSPMDLAGALRGEQLYYDFYDSPEELHGLLAYCADATIAFAEDLYRLADKHLGGLTYGTWYLKNKINMSEDISCMFSADLYREFAAPYTQRVIDHFGVGYMHCHSRAMYLVKEICSLKNVASLWLATDPNQPRPIDHIPELVRDARGVSVAIDCSSLEEIERNKQALAEGNFSICMPVKDVEEAKEAVGRFEDLGL